MKIVILGSHGTGKTTLAKRLLGYLRDNYEFKIEKISHVKDNQVILLEKTFGRLHWVYLPETPFEATQHGFSMNKETSLESEFWMIAKQIELEMRSAPWVADKCLIDMLAYARYFFADQPHFLKIIEDICLRNINYDLVFYLPSNEFPIEDDGLRLTDRDFQLSIDNIIKQIFADLSIPYQQLPEGRDLRFEKAKAIIAEHIK